MSTADGKGDAIVESGANRLDQLSHKAAARGGLAGKLADELADDASFLRKLKPSLMVARAKGEAPKDAEPGAPVRAPSPPDALAARAGGEVRSPGDEGVRPAAPPQAARPRRRGRDSAGLEPLAHSENVTCNWGNNFPEPGVTLDKGGSVLVLRRIQTPSVAGSERGTAEGEVVLGAPPPARPGLLACRGSATRGSPTRKPLKTAASRPCRTGLRHRLWHAAELRPLVGSRPCSRTTRS